MTTTPKQLLAKLELACSRSSFFGPRRAFAHVQKGEAAGFLSGLKHPVSGLDHVLAMVAVGLWGAQLGAPAVWVLPVAFPMVMAFGGMLGLMGVPLPGIEYGIAASAILLGVAVMFEAPSAAGSRRSRGRNLRHLPRTRARHRTASRTKRPALQHGIRDRHRMPAWQSASASARFIAGDGDRNSFVSPEQSSPWAECSSCGRRSQHEADPVANHEFRSTPQSCSPA